MGNPVPPMPGVYRAFDAEDNLLYVGVSGHVLSRLATHRRTSWITEVDRITVQIYPTYAEAARAEKEAIYAEQPAYCQRGLDEAPPPLPVPVVPLPPVQRPTTDTPEQRVLRVLGRMVADESGQPVLRRQITRRVTSSLPKAARKNVAALVSTTLDDLISQGLVIRKVLGHNPVNRLPIERFTVPEHLILWQ